MIPEHHDICWRVSLLTIKKSSCVPKTSNKYPGFTTLPAPQLIKQLDNNCEV